MAVMDQTGSGDSDFFLILFLERVWVIFLIEWKQCINTCNYANANNTSLFAHLAMAHAEPTVDHTLTQYLLFYCHWAKVSIQPNIYLYDWEITHKMNNLFSELSIMLTLCAFP